MSIKERMNPYADTRVGNPAIFEYHPAAQPAVQEPVAWTGCGGCDCSFPCHGGRTACIRNVESECASPSMTSGDRTEYEARIRRLGEALTLQYESGERLAARIMELEEATQPAAQPAPVQDSDHEFKNFHRLLCDRFGYTHDDVDWKRDQISLIEWIAKQALAAPTVQEPVAWPVGSAEYHRSLLVMGKALAWQRSREIGDAWNQLANLLTVLEKARSATPPAQPAAPEGWLHQCRKKPELKVLSFNRQEPELAAKGYVPVPLGRIAAPKKGQP